MAEPEREQAPEEQNSESRTSPTRSHIVRGEGRQQYHKNDKVWMKKPNEDRKFAMTVEKSQMIPGTTIMEYVLKDLDGKLYKDGEFVPQSWVIGKR